jgi:hypothetical protein
MPGAQCTRSLAGRKTSRTSSNSHHGHTGITRHSPRNGVTAYFVLSPVIRIWLTPSLADCVRQLDTDHEASGPHDFAVRISAVRQ